MGVDKSPLVNGQRSTKGWSEFASKPAAPAVPEAERSQTKREAAERSETERTPAAAESGPAAPPKRARAIATDKQAGNDWAQAIARLPRPLLLAFDVDGTLAPIVEDVAKAGVPAAVQRDLRRLSALRGVKLAVITGRDLRSLRTMLRVPSVYRAVEHGAVVLLPGETPRQAAPKTVDLQKLQKFEAWVRETAVPRGAELEIKRTSRAIHVRKLAMRMPETATALLNQAAVVASAAGLHPRLGRAVLEAELTSGDKGEALATIVRKSRCKGVFFAGDDRTDLPAIERAVALGGIGLFVRSKERPRKPKGASGAVDGTTEIAQIIAQLVSLLT